MDYLTVGQWSIPINWLAFIIAMIYIDYRMKKLQQEATKHIDGLLIVYVLIWKLSYIAFDFNSFIQAPLSIVYFDGGLAGHLTALAVLALYVWWKKLQHSPITLYVVMFVSVFNVIKYLLLEQWLLTVLYVIILFLIERRYSYWLIVIQWFLILFVEGWQSYFVYVLGFVILIDFIMFKKLQLLAAVFVASLISSMLTTLPMDIQPKERQSIHLDTTTGEQYVLAEQQEQIIIVNFFATWCPPCNAEMPHLQKFSESLPADTQLIGINLVARDNGDEALQNFLTKYDVDYPILLDTYDEFGTSYHVRSIPTTVILQEGQEVKRIVGPISEEQLKKLINNLN